MAKILFMLGLIGLWVAWTIWRMDEGKEQICRNCGYRGGGEMVTPGSFLIEVILWACLIIPGLVYSLWRHSRRHQACPSCHERQLIPAASPIGRQLINSHHKGEPR
jgi:hypothetical protein